MKYTDDDMTISIASFGDEMSDDKKFIVTRFGFPKIGLCLFDDVSEC